jgi:O-antigen/teichoic acid export membrane protein
VAFGLGALLLGYGFVGLAGVTIVVNAITMTVLAMMVWRFFFRPRSEFDLALQREMVSESFPLMLNHLLATLFFKIDIPMIRAMRGEAEIGRYGTAYKFVDAFNIIPAFFTFALFPLMSRQAAADRPALTRTYHLAIKLLVAVALPLAMVTTFLAAPLVGLLGGHEFLPDGALALQLIIWSIPFGWINSVTNYLLVAIGQQRALTRAFVIAVAFNIAINAMFIPRYGFRAAAISTILSEIVVGAAFQWYVFRHLNPTPWRRLFWRLGAAALLMAATTWLGAQLHVLLGLLLGGCVYLAATIILGVFAVPERKLLAELLPGPVRNRITALRRE